MKRTKTFKIEVCATCRSADKKVEPVGSVCKAKNPRITDGKCSEYRR